jgi:RNase P subunit RPR2
MYEIADAVDQDKELHIAQARFCQDKKLPDFTCTKCPKCRSTLRNGLMRNMTYNQALTHCQSTLITGCPNCGYSWCD